MYLVSLSTPSLDVTFPPTPCILGPINTLPFFSYIPSLLSYILFYSSVQCFYTLYSLAALCFIQYTLMSALCSGVFIFLVPCIDVKVHSVLSLFERLCFLLNHNDTFKKFSFEIQSFSSHICIFSHCISFLGMFY